MEYNHLRSLGIVYNKQLCCLICLECHIAIRPIHIKTHIYNQHPLLKSNYCWENLLEVFLEIDGLLDDLPNLDPGLKPFYQGLTIYDALLCSQCDKIYLSLASMKQHHSQIHSDLLMPKNWQSVKAQQLNHSDHKSFFRIDLPPAPATVTPDFIIKDLHNRQQLVYPNPLGQRLDPRLISPFLQSTGWLQLLKGNSIISLIGLASMPQKNEFPGLAEAVYQLYDDGEQLFAKVPELVLQRLVSPDPAKQYVNNI